MAPMSCACGIDIHAHVVPEHFHERRPLARLAEAGFDAATQAALVHGNAQRFLGRSVAVLPQESS